MKLKRIIMSVIILLFIAMGLKIFVKKVIFPYRYKEIVDNYSNKYDLDPLLVLAVIKTESNFNTEAESVKGAKGLMQIMDTTGSWIADKVGIEGFYSSMLYDPEINIQFGCWYLDNLLLEFDDLSLALAAYNGGSGNVAKWLSNPEYSEDGQKLDYIPFSETKKYVDIVTTRYSIYKFLYE